MGRLARRRRALSNVQRKRGTRQERDSSRRMIPGSGQPVFKENRTCIKRPRQSLSLDIFIHHPTSSFSHSFRSIVTRLLTCFGVFVYKIAFIHHSIP